MEIISAIKELNFLAIFTALIVHFLIGILWYSPLLFGKKWKEYRQTDEQPGNKMLLVGITAHVIHIFVLAVIIKLINASVPADGIVIGILLSIGFIGMTLVNEFFYSKMNFRLFLIKIGDEIISICASALILVLWK